MFRFRVSEFLNFWGEKIWRELLISGSRALEPQGRSSVFGSGFRVYGLGFLEYFLGVLELRILNPKP